MLVIFKSVTYEVSKLDWNEVKAKFCLTDNQEMRVEAQFHSDDGRQVVLTANCPLLFENSINYYIHKSSITFQPCKITMTYFEKLIDKWNCNISCLMCGLMTTN